MNYINKKSSEVVPLSVDFTNLLATGETVSTAALAVNLVSGVDPAYASIIPVGAPTITAGVITSKVLNGVDGVVYQIDCTITTSLGNTYKITTEVEIFDSVTARQQFADFCLRQLGAPVINIEVSNEQVEDCIAQAVRYYHEYHFDGIERDYYVYQIVGTKITVANASIFQVGGTVWSADGKTSALIAAVDTVNNIITTNRQMGIIKFAVGNTVSPTYPATTSTAISAIVLGDPDNGYIPAQDTIVGVKKILNITSILGSADYMFNVQYQIMLSEVQNLVSQGVSYFYNVQQYLGYLDFVMKKEKDFRFNRRMNRLYLDIAWSVDVRVGDIVIAEVYRALDESLFPEVYQDIWLTRYSTSLIKKIWGGNLRKYQGMSLPGGVTFNGQQIYNEAIEEIKELEAEAIYSTSPLEFMIG